MKLIINKRVIKEPIENILSLAKKETGYFDDILPRRDDVVCTCPFHSDGHEKKPACYVKSNPDDEIEYGTFHCFSCGQSGSLAKLVGQAYGRSEFFGRNWLIDHFGDTYIEEVDILPPLLTNSEKSDILSEEYLKQFDYGNEVALNYLIGKRRLSKEVIEKYQIGFDKSDDTVTFPMRDEHGNLLGVSKRNVYSKFFHIPKEIEIKPVYLLDEVIRNNESPVVVCESQINALTIRSWGMYSIALFGTGSKEQYKILNKSGIRNYILAFDGDLAGKVGANKFVNSIKTAVITQVVLPNGKDVNDLTKEEFMGLERVER